MSNLQTSMLVATSLLEANLRMPMSLFPKTLKKMITHTSQTNLKLDMIGSEIQAMETSLAIPTLSTWLKSIK